CSNVIDPTYRGTVTITSTDTQAVKNPASHVYVAGDNGSFTYGLTFHTAGTQTITASDGTSPVTSGPIVVSSTGTVTQLLVNAPAGATANDGFSVTVIAADTFGNTVSSYTGTVHFALQHNDPSASLPANYTFTAGDAGTHTFAFDSATNTGGVILVAT